VRISDEWSKGIPCNQRKNRISALKTSRFLAVDQQPFLTSIDFIEVACRLE
jgi:hypothetical protein